MARNTQNIVIESILGGQSSLGNFTSEGQFKGSYAIDPDQPSADTGTQSVEASGFLRPVSSKKIDSGTSFANAPLHMVSNPKDDFIYIYDAVGSVYTLNPSNYALAALAEDLNDTASDEPQGSIGNGSAYYDNYIYFARATTVARYGPLNGTPSFTEAFWTTTLSKSALLNTTYPSHTNSSYPYPNHPMHRHSDGRLYFGDVVDNQGMIHYIQTTKTTVEGDTDSSSKEQALDFGHGLRPIAIDSYNTEIAIALYEGSNDTSTFQKRAILAFWDTASASPNKLIQVEFPDPIITALRNVNGILYTFSGQLGSRGTRVCRFVGGYTYEQIAFLPDSLPPFDSAVDHLMNKLMLAGTITAVNDGTALASVWGLGSKTGAFSGVYNIMGATNTSATAEITSLKVIDGDDGLNFQIPVIGHSDGTNHGVDRQTSDYGRISQIWRSETFRIGQPFKVLKIRLPLAQAVAANMTVVPKIFVDEQDTSYTLTTINNTNYADSEKNIVIRPDNATGEHSFFLELKWSGTALATFALPITMEVEILDD